jgi:hypothetical protein
MACGKGLADRAELVEFGAEQNLGGLVAVYQRDGRCRQQDFVVDDQAEAGRGTSDANVEDFTQRIELQFVQGAHVKPRKRRWHRPPTAR